MKSAPHPGYCLACGTRENITRDHVVPKSVMKALGLHSTRDNFQPLCSPCNGDKANTIVDYRPAAAHEKLVAYLAEHGVTLDFIRRGAAEPHRGAKYFNVA